MQQPTKRKLTKEQRKRLKRRQRQEKLFNSLLVVCVAAVFLAAIVLVLRPKDTDEVYALSRKPAPTYSYYNSSLIPPPSTPTPVPTATPAPVMRSVRLRAGSEITATEPQLKAALAAGTEGSYNFAPQFELIAPAVQNADYTLVPLGTTIGKYQDKPYTGAPRFNAPESLLQAMHDAGYDFLALGNDHILDRWFDGLKLTINNAEQTGFTHSGAYRSMDEFNTPKVISIGGVKIGFLSYTQTTNGLEEEADAGAKLYGVAYLDKADFVKDVQALRRAGAEVVIAFAHWGGAVNREPDDTQLAYARRIAEAGADVILGSNPGVVQKVENLTVTSGDGSTRTVLCAYSLGNLISDNTTDPYTDSSILLDFTLREREDGTFAVTDVGYVPTYSWRHDGTFLAVPSAKYQTGRPEGMSDQAYDRMIATLNELRQLLSSSATMLIE